MADNMNLNNRRGRDTVVPKRSEDIKGYRDFSAAAHPIRDEEPSTLQVIEDRFENIYHNIENLVTTQFELAKTEISEKTSQVKKGAAEITTGGMMAFYGGQALMLTAILVLNFLMNLWIAALIVGVAMVGIGAAMMAAGKKNLEPDNLMPERTMRSVKKDAEAMRNMTEGRR